MICDFASSIVYLSSSKLPARRVERATKAIIPVRSPHPSRLVRVIAGPIFAVIPYRLINNCSRTIWFIWLARLGIDRLLRS